MMIPGDDEASHVTGQQQESFFLQPDIRLPTPCQLEQQDLVRGYGSPAAAAAAAGFRPTRSRLLLLGRPAAGTAPAVSSDGNALIMGITASGTFTTDGGSFRFPRRRDLTHNTKVIGSWLTETSVVVTMQKIGIKFRRAGDRIIARSPWHISLDYGYDDGPHDLVVDPFYSWQF